MNRDDIIRMAREADLNGEILWLNKRIVGYEEEIAFVERFAALVATAEREAMLADGWRQCAKGQRTTHFCLQLQKAVEAEREECAKICDEVNKEYDGEEVSASWIAVAIRARGNNV